MEAHNAELEAQIDVDHLADRLSGRGSGLRSSKPDTDNDDGLVQYVWRMAAFHSGEETSMPVTATWWLQDFLDNNDIDAKVTGVQDEAGKDVIDTLEAVTDVVLGKLGESQFGAASRWKATRAF